MIARFQRIVLAGTVAASLSFAAPAIAMSHQTELQFVRAAKLYNQKHVLEARAILSKLSEGSDCNATILCLLADTYLAEEAYGMEKNPGIVKQLMERALKLDPEWGNAYKIQAQVENVQGHYEQAIKLCTKALSVKSRDPRAYLQRTLAYQALNRKQEALNDITTYINTADNSDEMYNVKGSVLMTMKRYDEAIVAYKASLQKHFKDWTIYRIVECYELQKQYDPAIAQVTILIKANPNDAEAYEIRARLQSLCKRFDKAADDYTSAIKLEPGARTFKKRAAIYKILGKNNEAAADLKKAATEDSMPF